MNGRSGGASSAVFFIIALWPPGVLDKAGNRLDTHPQVRLVRVLRASAAVPSGSCDSYCNPTENNDSTVAAEITQSTHSTNNCYNESKASYASDLPLCPQGSALQILSQTWPSLQLQHVSCGVTRQSSCMHTWPWAYAAVHIRSHMYRGTVITQGFTYKKQGVVYVNKGFKLAAKFR